MLYHTKFGDEVNKQNFNVNSKGLFTAQKPLVKKENDNQQRDVRNSKWHDV